MIYYIILINDYNINLMHHNCNKDDEHINLNNLNKVC